MKLEDQVCSIEQSKEFKRLGLDRCHPQFYWHPVPTEDGEKMQLWPEHMLIVKGHVGTPAFTVAELGILLGKFRVVKRSTVQEPFWRLESLDFTINYEFPLFNVENEAQARAKALIYLINLKLIDPKGLTLCA